MSSVLERAEPHAVVDGAGRRWPVVAGIPFLRAGREALAEAALAALDAGDERGAAILLLADRDDWAPGDPPTPEACAAALDAPTLREAMRHLAYGPVADYFAYRWSDPTFLSGLALLGAHGAAAPGVRLFELACGTGAFLRALRPPHGAGTLGADVVWSKLWLAKRFVAPEAELVCFDAARGPFPLADGAADVAFCHDALYFLPEKAHVVAELARVAPRVLVGHAHNARADNFSAGAPLAPAEYAALLPGEPVLYEDAKPTRALLEDRPPRAAPDAAALDDAAAIALAWPAAEPGPAGALALAPAGAKLRRNPLLDPVTLAPRWPSRRYEAEYAADSGYLSRPRVDRAALHGSDPALVRRRILLDLPAAW